MDKPGGRLSDEPRAYQSLLLSKVMANLVAAGASAILEKKQMLEEDLRRVEKQIYDLEGDYLQVRRAERFKLFATSPLRNQLSQKIIAREKNRGAAPAT